MTAHGCTLEPVDVAPQGVAFGPVTIIGPAFRTNSAEDRKSLMSAEEFLAHRKKTYAKSAPRQGSLLAGIPRFPRHQGIIQLWWGRNRNS